MEEGPNDATSKARGSGPKAPVPTPSQAPVKAWTRLQRLHRRPRSCGVTQLGLLRRFGSWLELLLLRRLISCLATSNGRSGRGNCSPHPPPPLAASMGCKMLELIGLGDSGGASGSWVAYADGPRSFEEALGVKRKPRRICVFRDFGAHPQRPWEPCLGPRPQVPIKAWIRLAPVRSTLATASYTPISGRPGSGKSRQPGLSFSQGLWCLGFRFHTVIAFPILRIWVTLSRRLLKSGLAVVVQCRCMPC